MADLQIPETEHYREAIDSVRKRVPVPRDVWDDMQAEEREHAFTVSQVARIDVLQDVLDSVDKAVEKGTALDDFRAEVADKLIEQWGGAEIPGRIETIFRTNIQVAYAEGRHAINSAPAVKEARPFWRYDDTDNDRECDLCHECHGVVLPANDPWWATHHPPLHHQCECTVTALSPEEAEEEGLTSSSDIPDVEADEGFGNEPTSEGKDWAPDLTDLDPELRKALEEKLNEYEREQPSEPRKAPERIERPEPAERRPERVPRAEPEQDPQIAPAEKIAQHFDGFTVEHIDKASETASVLNADGESVFVKAGKGNKVSFAPRELSKMEDGHLVHNHPSGNSLSPTDLNLAVERNMRSMTAVGRDPYTGKVREYSFTRPEGGWPSKDEIAIAQAGAEKEAFDHLKIAIKYQAMTKEEANFEWFHEVWKRTQKRLNIGYREKVRGDEKK